MTPEALVAAVSPKIADMGWAFYFIPETAAQGAEFGLEVFDFYFLGRGGVLGDTSPEVVMSSFGYFNPALLQGAWERGSKLVAPHIAAAAYHECCANLGRAKLADLDDLDGFVNAAETVVNAADPTGLALFAGIASLPLADDLPGRAQQLITTLREFRGSAHLVALRATGLQPKTAHFIKRPEAIEFFGWKKEDGEIVDDSHHDRLAAAELITDAIVTTAYAALNEAGQDALLNGVNQAHAILRPPK